MQRFLTTSVLFASCVACSLVVEPGAAPDNAGADGAVVDAMLGMGGIADAADLDAAADAATDAQRDAQVDAMAGDGEVPPDMAAGGHPGDALIGSLDQGMTDAMATDASPPRTDAGNSADAGDGAVSQDASPPMPDGAVDAAPNPDPCQFERRCDSRIAQECVDGEVRETVCERTERCAEGACEVLPEGVYGNACRVEQDRTACENAGLVCAGPAAILFCLHPDTGQGPIGLGGECYGARECIPGLLCTRSGRCATGENGTPCIDDDDCTGVCAERQCGDPGDADPVRDR